MNKAIFLLLLSLVLLPLHVFAVARVLLPLHVFAVARVGAWSPIKDVKDPHVVEIGKFAVSEYDKQSKSILNFVTVVRGEFQVVSGVNYRLVVTADDGSNNASKNYEAIVLEKPWLKSMNLTSFTPLLKNRFL